MRDILRSLFIRVLSSDSAISAYMFMRPGKRRAILYHGVSGRAYEKQSEFVIDVQRFEQQIAYLTNRFKVITIAQWTALMDHAGRLPERTIAITFDDGYRNNLEFVVPILKKYGLRATFYVCPQFIEWAQQNLRVVQWWDIFDYVFNSETCQDFIAVFNAQGIAVPACTDVCAIKSFMADYLKKSADTIVERLTDALRQTFAQTIAGIHFPEMMHWGHIKQMQGEGMELGAHTQSHGCAARMSDDDFVKDIRFTKEQLERSLHCPVTSFAFPYGESGHYSLKNIQALKDSGYTSAVLALTDSEERDNFCINRTPIVKLDSMGMFKIKACGMYDDIRCLKLKLMRLKSLFV